jgi:hypothetical protein
VKTIQWFNPRSGKLGKPLPFSGEKITAPDKEDWLAILK